MQKYLCLLKFQDMYTWVNCFSWASRDHCTRDTAALLLCFDGEGLCSHFPVRSSLLSCVVSEQNYVPFLHLLALLPADLWVEIIFNYIFEASMKLLLGPSSHWNSGAVGGSCSLLTEQMHLISTRVFSNSEVRSMCNVTFTRLMGCPFSVYAVFWCSVYAFVSWL